MLKKSQRLRNLKQLRLQFGTAFQKLCQQEKISITELAATCNLPTYYSKAIWEGRANMNFAQCNYLASCFNKRIHVEFID